MVVPLFEKIPFPNPIEAGGANSLIFISPHGADSKGLGWLGKVEEPKIELLLTSVGLVLANVFVCFCAGKLNGPVWLFKTGKNIPPYFLFYFFYFKGYATKLYSFGSSCMFFSSSSLICCLYIYSFLVNSA